VHSRSVVSWLSECGAPVDETAATTKDAKDTKMEFDEPSSRVIGCAIEAHQHLRVREGQGRNRKTASHAPFSDFFVRFVSFMVECFPPDGRPTISSKEPLMNTDGH